MNNLKAEKHRLLFQGHSTGYSFRPRPWSWSRRLIFSTFNGSILFTLPIEIFILGLTYLVCIFFELRERFLRTNNSRYENAETKDSWLCGEIWLDGHLADWVACRECTDWLFWTSKPASKLINSKVSDGKYLLQRNIYLLYADNYVIFGPCSVGIVSSVFYSRSMFIT